MTGRLYNPFLFPPWLFWLAGEETCRMSLTSDETTTPPGELFALVTKRKHVFGPRLHVSAYDSPSTHEQHEWKCQCCPLFKITVLPRGQQPRREYRHADGCQFEDEREPECVPVVTRKGAT